MGDQNEEQWLASAQALGLTLRKRTWRTHIADNFGALMQSLGGAVHTREDVRESWMVGHRRGAHVAVDVTWPRRVGLDMGSGRRRSHVTEVVVAIDPPLLLGLRVASTSLLDVREGPDFDIGHPELDPKFEISSFIPARAAELLLPHAQRLLALRSESKWMLVTDNLVHVGFDRAMCTLAELGPAIDRVIDTVHALSQQRAAMKNVGGEVPYEAFERLAQERGLTFDPMRMKIEGDLHGVAVELRFCTANGRPYYAARARMPRPLGVGLRIGAQSADDGATIFFDDDSPDIEIGDPFFDEAFVIEASNEDRARALLAVPSVRHAAMDVLRLEGNLVATDTYVAASLPDPKRGTWLLDQVAMLAGALGGGSGPYR